MSRELLLAALAAVAVSGCKGGNRYSELAKKALGDHVFTSYVKLKRKEWDDYRVQLTPWEMENYLGVL